MLSDRKDEERVRHARVVGELRVRAVRACVSGRPASKGFAFIHEMREYYYILYTPRFLDIFISDFPTDSTLPVVYMAWQGRPGFGYPGW